MKTPKKVLFPTLLMLALAACVAPAGLEQEAAEATEVADTEVPAVPAEPEAMPAEAGDEVEREVEIEYGNFTEEQLYQAIISEISGQRGHMEEAGDTYLDLAMSTRDLTVIRRAVQFASANGDSNALLQLGLLWSQVSPGDPQPHLALSFEFLENDNFDQALSHMSRVIDLGGSMDFTVLAARTGRLPPATRSRLIESLRRLSNEYPEQESIQLALVQLLAQNQEYENALVELQQLVDGGELSPMLVRLEAQILQSKGDSEGALQALADGTGEFPDDRILRLSYARMLVQQERYAEARDQFQVLVESQDTDWETWYSLALLDMELENYDSAVQILERLIDADERADESRYYLGVIHQEQDNLETAIEHYRQVRVGTDNYLAAQQQATRLSIQLGKLDEAHAWLVRQSRGQPRLEILFTTIESGALVQAGHTGRARELLNTALNRHPNETDLLFARVLLNDNAGDQAASERDLRQIIRMQPEDARALNHLGYMLADQTDRYQEALELIERAIDQSPDDPAIIDSLGWAQYKLGHYEEALGNLRRAYAAFPDHEVASHLGEVLWQLDRREEAVEVWEEALEDRPDSELIQEVMDRFLPDR